ncbi:TetR/AcrR family transcriptional regulator [Bradyrhizobium sp. STM 3557]|uniref:TetR/AcrR family transcriptional regulator n=1 Tax=Bradyrhizobium sp. STM 3557 TaxID=578920 RepID=UPI00388EA3D9
MARSVDIALKKQPKQQRAIATVDAILEAATYILTHDGPSGFTANKVAEKAGVNISSFYQYYPNKEALLFHLVRVTWEKQLARLSPILLRRGRDHAQKLRDFIREFFMIEAAEADLRRALRIASVDLRDTAEFRALIATGTQLFKQFVEGALKNRRSDDLDFEIDFAVTLVTSFAERTTDERTSGATLIRQADLLSDMLIATFRM